MLESAIPGLLLLTPKVFGDDRGFFFESYNARGFAEAVGMPLSFPQDNHSGSCKGVLRGLHYQLERPQGKLVRVIAGAIFDVAVDLRRSSSTFGRWASFLLTAANRQMVWIPPGFAHGFLAMSDWAEVLYKASDFYDPASERTILWNDPELAIDWPLEGEPLLSRKDSAGVSLSEADLFP